MTPVPSLLDTDILSAVMRKHPQATTEAKVYLKIHSRLTFSIITRYEILRGLKAKKAAVQLPAFDRFCRLNQVLSLTDDIVDRASDIYADLHQRGMLIGDADILIAATALVYGFSVVTNNEAHFNRVSGLKVENWLK
jgi:tRNA(fMet)-specific endonuclease VapC